jgi:hypothetical protein
MSKENNVRTKSKATRTIANNKIIFKDSLSVPNIIGIGPIIRMPPPLVFPFALFALEKMSRITAKKATAKPTRIKANPAVQRDCPLIILISLLHKELQ